MLVTPEIATVASLIGERARAEMLICLVGGRSLTATELSRAARVTKQTASAHLSKLVAARLVAVESVGRNRYFRLADHEVGTVLENLVGLAHRVSATQVRTGPADAALRKARVCYDHLAGELGVLVFDSLKQQGFLGGADTKLTLHADGHAFFGELGINVAALNEERRPLVLPCLDWSVRRHHLAGALGAAFLQQCFVRGWARRQKGTRVIAFSALGERALRAKFRFREP